MGVMNTPNVSALLPWFQAWLSYEPVDQSTYGQMVFVSLISFSTLPDIFGASGNPWIFCQANPHLVSTDNPAVLVHVGSEGRRMEELFGVSSGGGYMCLPNHIISEAFSLIKRMPDTTGSGNEWLFQRKTQWAVVDTWRIAAGSLSKCVGNVCAGWGPDCSWLHRVCSDAGDMTCFRKGGSWWQHTQKNSFSSR